MFLSFRQTDQRIIAPKTKNIQQRKSTLFILWTVMYVEGKQYGPHSIIQRYDMDLTPMLSGKNLVFF